MCDAEACHIDIHRVSLLVGTALEPMHLTDSARKKHSHGPIQIKLPDTKGNHGTNQVH